MRFLRAIAAISLLWLCALTPTQQVVLFGNLPNWVMKGASPDLDFANNRSFGCGGSFTGCLSIARAQSSSFTTDLLPSSASGFAYLTYAANTLRLDSLGLLIEEARTNLFLNSTAPVTQTINFAATGNYTLWVNGSGTITVSVGTGVGCGVGIASNGTSVTFNITVAGTCVFTKAGSLNAAQVEAGTFGTSLIITAGVALARNADVITAAGTLLTVLNGSAGAILAAINSTPTVANTSSIVYQNNREMLTINSATQIGSFNGATNFTATLGSGTYSANSTKSMNLWSATARNLVANNGTLTTSATAFGASTGVYNIGGLPATRFIDTYITRLTAWAVPPTNAQGAALTQ